DDISWLPAAVEDALAAELPFVGGQERFLVAGAGRELATAHEAVLKLREGAWVAAEAYETEQLMHGYFAAIDESVRAFVLDGRRSSIAALWLSTSPFARPMLCTVSKSRSVSIFAAFFGHAIHRPSEGESVFFSAGNRRSSSSRRVVKKTSTSAPGLAPSFCDNSGTGEELALLLARERRALLARFEAPLERVARRLLQRAEGQTRSDRA